jgi:hypothetical protein
MDSMTKHPLFKVWSFPSVQMTRMSVIRSEMVVLNVKYEDKDKAKQTIGAQFDPLSQMWFFNKDTRWNRDLDLHGTVMKSINDNNWFVGFSYTDRRSSLTKYETPYCNYSWLNQPLTPDELSDKNRATTYTWYKKGDDGGLFLPLVEIVIVKREGHSISFVVVYQDHPVDCLVQSVREIPMEEARKLWDVCEKNYRPNTYGATSGWNAKAKDFIEHAMVAAGVEALAVESAVKTPMYQHKTPVNNPTNYALTA